MASEIGQLAQRAAVMLSLGGTTESGRSEGPVDDAKLARAVEKVLRSSKKSVAGQADDELIARTARNVVARGREALSKVEGGMPAANLSDEAVSALELIVHTVGRPAMRYRNGHVETPANSIADNAQWYMLVTTERDRINGLSSRVGRIACEHGIPEPVVGTGWRVGSDLIITNRHVVVPLVTAPGTSPETWNIDSGKAPFVDFAFTDETAGLKSFRIKEAVYVAPDIDLALLRIVSESAVPPPPIPIDWTKQPLGRELPPAGDTASVFQGAEVYAVGHPYRRSITADIESVFQGQVDGRKRWAPGLITLVDANQPVLRHDCSTLGGNSGSPIVSTDAADHVAVGLHYGGQPDSRGVGLGSTNLAVAFSRISDHPATQFLKP